MKIAVAVVIKDKKVFIQKRFRRNIGMIHEFPCGKVDENESFESAAQRELREETGMDHIIFKDMITAETESGDDIAFVVFDGCNATEPYCVEPARKQTFYWMNIDDIPLQDLQKADVQFIEQHLCRFIS